MEDGPLTEPPVKPPQAVRHHRWDEQRLRGQAFGDLLSCRPRGIDVTQHGAPLSNCARLFARSGSDLCSRLASAPVLRRHPNRALLIAALVMLAVAVQRFVVTFDHRPGDCGEASREHLPLLLLQSMTALGIAAGLALSCPAMVQGARWYRRGALALLVVSALAFLAIFATPDLTAFSTDC